MPRLTAELIADSPQFTNPVKEWELDLRAVEVLVLPLTTFTRSHLPGRPPLVAPCPDQFDVIDFSDNEIRKVDGFPVLTKLRSLLINNNRVCRIVETLDECLPRLESLVLTNNNIEELSDIDPLASLRNLTYLSLLRNPVVHKPSYRLYVIHQLPQLRVLDFKRIRQKERIKAREVFGKPEEEKARAAKRAKVFTPGQPARPAAPPKPPTPTGPSPQEIAKIREAIAGARSLEEVQQLEAMLKAGQIPGQLEANHHPQGSEVEEDEMES